MLRELLLAFVTPLHQLRNVEMFELCFIKITFPPAFPVCLWQSFPSPFPHPGPAATRCQSPRWASAHSCARAGTAAFIIQWLSNLLCFRSLGKITFGWESKVSSSINQLFSNTSDSPYKNLCGISSGVNFLLEKHCMIEQCQRDTALSIGLFDSVNTLCNMFLIPVFLPLACYLF